MQDLFNKAIKELIDQYPQVGEILREHNIACALCTAGTCRLKDVVEVHNIPPQDASRLLCSIAEVVGLDPAAVRAHLSHFRRAPKAPQAAHSPVVKKLMDEHAVIKRWLALIPRFMESLDLNSPGGRQRVLDAVEFIRLYADQYHHAKEEDSLFKRFDESLDILKVMHEDHQSARSHVRAICQAVSAGDRAAVAEHLAAYRNLLNEHIKKEDEILYPWMERELSDRQVGELFAEFAEVDRRFGDTPAKCVGFLEALERELGGSEEPLVMASDNTDAPQ